MITNPRPLEPDFIPSDVVHRDTEINALSAALQPDANGMSADTAILHGPSGTGKTCIAKHTLRRIETELAVTTQHVNCWEHHRKFTVLEQLLEALNQAHDIHRQSTPKDALLSRLRDAVDSPYVVSLDEADQLNDDSILYELYRLPEVELILITDDEQALLGGFEERVASRFQTALTVPFDRYTVPALVSILRKRVRNGLRPDAIDEQQLRLIADTAAGDARVAIATLRMAARLSSQQNRSHITEEIVEKAVAEAKSEIREDHLQQLTPDQQILYDAIQDAGEIDPASLYHEYSERAPEPKSQRMVRNYLKKLRRYNLVRAEGEGRAREYRAVG